MKLLPLTRKKIVTTNDVGRPQPVPQLQVPQDAGPVPERIPSRHKRLGMALQEEDALLLSRSIRQGSAPSIDTDSPRQSLRLPNNASVVSFASSLSLRERRSSSRSLELLRAAEDEGRLPDWHNLPPSPGAPNVALIRKFSQWGEEAGSDAEKLQRVRLVRLFVQAAQNGLSYLTIDDADLVVDLPDALSELSSLRALTLRNLRRITRVPDLRQMAFLQHVEVMACPDLRLPPMAHQQVVVDGVEQNPLHQGARKTSRHDAVDETPSARETRTPRALGSAHDTGAVAKVSQPPHALAGRPKNRLLSRWFGGANKNSVAKKTP